MVNEPFVEPRHVVDVGDCYFYHTVDVPGHGVMRGEWDLRANLDAYFGHYDFAARRVLDVGTASGALTFHAERKGADVVSYDLSDGHSWDIVPFANLDRGATDAARRQHIRRVNNGYWFCHRVFASRAKVVYGIAYDIPDAIGEVDVAVYGGILLHLRDPFLALERGARLARRAIIVTEICRHGRFGRWLGNPKFVPRPTRPDQFDTWWNLPPRPVRDYLAILGFPKSTVTWHRQLFLGRPTTMYTIVARRD
ncbi:MAG TPA: hypothetical protein VJ890_02865 [Vineibacter sp.]|nr:hypothetical protein [Vineibacter sp.]